MVVRVQVLVIAAFLALLIKPKTTTEDDVVYKYDIYRAPLHCVKFVFLVLR